MTSIMTGPMPWKPTSFRPQPVGPHALETDQLQAPAGDGGGQTGGQLHQEGYDGEHRSVSTDTVLPLQLVANLKAEVDDVDLEHTGQNIGQDQHHKVQGDGHIAGDVAAGQ